MVYVLSVVSMLKRVPPLVHSLRSFEWRYAIKVYVESELHALLYINCKTQCYFSTTDEMSPQYSRAFVYGITNDTVSAVLQRH